MYLETIHRSRAYIRIPPDNVIPRANFSVVPKYGTAPLEIAIIDQAQSMVNYTVSNVPLVYNYTIWKNGVKLFQNTTKNVNVTLSDPGVYQIIQNVTNSFGRSNEFTVGDIVVNLPDKPIVNFSATVREGLAPLNVTLIDQTIGSKPFTYEWVIGNDTWRSQSKSDDNPQFNLTYSGNYWVNLTVTDKNGRFDSLNKTNFITVGPQKYPIAAFTAIPMSGPYPLNVSFIDQSVLNPDLFSSEGKDAVFKWDFGDGTNSTLKNPTHLYTQAGEYTVRLWIAHGGNMIASKPAMINVTEESDYPDLTLNASFTAVPDHGNPPLTVSFVDTSRKNEPVTYDWDFGDGSMHETAPNAIHTFTASSTVTLTITGAKSGRTSSYSHLVVVEDLDTNFIATVSGKTVSFMDYSTGFPTQWYWTFGDGYSSREQNPVHTYAASGTYSVTLSSWNELRKSVKSMVIEVP
jgi:PKD repeat protein